MIARRDLLRSAERWSGCLFVRGRTKWAKIKSIKVFMEFYERQEPLAMGVWPLTSSVLPAKSLPCFVPFFSLLSFLVCPLFLFLDYDFILYCDTVLYAQYSFVRWFVRSLLWEICWCHSARCMVHCCVLLDSDGFWNNFWNWKGMASWEVSWLPCVGWSEHYRRAESPSRSTDILHKVLRLLLCELRYNIFNHWNISEQRIQF